MLVRYFSLILLLLIFSNDSKCSFKDGLSRLKRRLSFADIKDPNFEIPDLNEPTFFFNHPHPLDSSEQYPTALHGANEDSIKREKDILRQPEIKIDLAADNNKAQSNSLIEQQHQSLHRDKKIKTENSAMEKDYEDLKSCIQKTKKQNWQTRQFEDLKKIETTLAEMIILIRVKIYEKFSPDNVSPYIEGLDKDLSRIVFERIIHNCFKNLFEVLNSDKNILKPGSSIEDVPLIPLVYKLFEYMEKFGLQENRLEKNKSLIKIFFSEEKPLKQLIWYICTVLIKERGFIGVFLTSDLKEYIRNHNDLDHIRFLLNSLDTEHWKEIELGFLEAHGILDYNGSVFHESFVKNNRRFSEYEKFIRKNELMLKNIQDIENTLPNMYKIDLTYPNRHIRGNRYALGNGILLANFIKCTFAYHVQNYLKRYQKNIKIENVEQHKIEIFGAFFKVFQNILKVITAFEDKFNFGTNTRKKISRTEFLLKLLNLMPSPDFYKDWVSGHPKKIFIKNSNSEYFLKYRHVELKKSKNSNISTILRTMKNEYDELTRQIIRSVDNGSKFDKSAIDCWYRIINIYIEFLHSILQDISEVEGGLEYLGLSKTEIHSFFKEL